MLAGRGCTHSCYGTLQGAESLLSLSLSHQGEFWASNSGCQVWPQAPLLLSHFTGQVPMALSCYNRFESETQSCGEPHYCVCLLKDTSKLNFFLGSPWTQWGSPLTLDGFSYERFLTSLCGPVALTGMTLQFSLLGQIFASATFNTTILTLFVSFSLAKLKLQ